MGRTPGSRPPRQPVAPFSSRTAIDERRQRAIEEALDVRIRSTDPFLKLEVRNPIHRTGYLVLAPTYPVGEEFLCTCTDFARRGLGTCKHIEAVVRWLAEHPEGATRAAKRGSPSRSRVWARIDRLLTALRRDPAPESLAWRRPGSALFELPAR
jgi:hypothetical protein